MARAAGPSRCREVVAAAVAALRPGIGTSDAAVAAVIPIRPHIDAVTVAAFHPEPSARLVARPAVVLVAGRVTADVATERQPVPADARAVVADLAGGAGAGAPAAVVGIGFRVDALTVAAGVALVAAVGAGRGHAGVANDAELARISPVALRADELTVVAIVLRYELARAGPAATQRRLVPLQFPLTLSLPFLLPLLSLLGRLGGRGRGEGEARRDRGGSAQHRPARSVPYQRFVQRVEPMVVGHGVRLSSRARVGQGGRGGATS
jgi:hypothetical protein